MSKLERYIPSDTENPTDITAMIDRTLQRSFGWEGTIFHETVEAATEDFAAEQGEDLVLWKVTFEKVEA